MSFFTTFTEKGLMVRNNSKLADDYRRKVFHNFLIYRNVVSKVVHILRNLLLTEIIGNIFPQLSLQFILFSQKSGNKYKLKLEKYLMKSTSKMIAIKVTGSYYVQL